MIKQHCFKSFTAATLILSSTLSYAHTVSIPCLKPGLEFSASALYLQPNANNLGWGAVTTVLPIPTPQWRVKTINPGYHAGFNLGAGYVFPCSGNDLQLNWSHLNTSDSQNVHVIPTTQWISPFSQTGTPPELGEITGVASLKRAHADAKFYYDAVNLDVGQYVDFGCRMRLRIFSGLSGVRIQEKLTSTFRGLPLPVLSFNNTASYTGVGPRLGVYNTFSIYRGLNFVSQFAGALLIGHSNPAEYKFTGSSAELALIGIAKNNEKIASSHSTDIVSALDAKLGLSYVFDMSQCSQLTIEGGYMAALYVHPLQSYETNTNVIALDIGSLSTSSVKHTLSNFSVGGLYLTANWKF